MNKVILMGRATKDAEARYTTGDNPMCITRYTLAVDRKGKDKGADFISCIAFGKGGEFAEKYIKKGTKMTVSGHIQTGSYTNKDGVKVYTTDVVVEEQEFAESKNSGEKAVCGTEKLNKKSNDPLDDFMSIPDGIDEAELPFN